jgi:uncharacterized membrane protein
MNIPGLPWNRWYSVRSYAWNSLWVVPVIVLFAQVLVKRLSERFGGWMVAEGFYDLTTGFFGLEMTNAQAFLDRIFTLNLSFLVFTFGSLLVAIQVAGGQYTPRIIATTLLRDNVIRSVVGLFIFTLLWANRSLNQLGGNAVPQFQVALALLLGLASLIAFLLLIDYSAKLLRPVSLVSRIGKSGLAVIQSVYPDPTQGVEPTATGGIRSWSPLSWVFRGETVRAAKDSEQRGAPDRTIDYRGRSGVLLAVNVEALVAAARRTGAVVELVPQVGDFVATGEDLFYVYGAAAAVDDDGLRALAAFGTERTMEQDPMFSFRILVDIAAKALSPAINDPTTAVLAIDQIHRLLRRVGLRNLRAEGIADDSGQVRLIVRTPNWEDFVHISFREIRMFGSSSLQIPRRLRAMVEDLIRTLPEHRHAALRAEMELLDRVIATQYALPEDLALARIPDPQGMGGSSRTRG